MSEEPSRSRRFSLLQRETWARRVAAAWRVREKTYRDRGLGWRLAVPAVFLAAGALFVTSSVASDGTDLRAGRYGDLSTVVAQATEEVNALQDERNALADEVELLSTRLQDTGVSRAQERVDDLMVPAGMAGMRGPGLTVELDDASPEEIESSGKNPSYLVVHQQDIQAVANAMWVGGAEAMTIQGQRVISTTGIKCVGNTVVLHGVPYSPPYVITAVGDPVAMLDEIEDSPSIEVYRDYAESYGLGWDVLPHSEVELPPYKGSLDLDYARPAGDDVDRDDDGI